MEQGGHRYSFRRLVLVMGEGMFGRIAGFVTRRYKLIVIAWVIALAVALPLVPLVNGVVQYEETSMAPSYIESSEAGAFIDRYFGNASAQPTTIIVLTSDDVTGAEVKQAVLSMQNSLKWEYANGTMGNVHVDSIYTVAETLTLNAVIYLGAAYCMADQTAYVIYGVPQEFAALWKEVNQTAGTDFANVTALAESMFWENIEATAGGMSVDQIDLLRGYLAAFTTWWNAIGAEPDRASFEAGVDLVASSFGENISDSMTRSVFQGVRQAVGGYATYNDLSMRRDALADMIAGSAALSSYRPEPWLVAAAGDLGIEATTGQYLALARQIVANSSLADFPIRIPDDVVSTLISPDNSTMLVALTYAPADDGSSPGHDGVSTVRKVVAQTVEGTGIAAYVTGSDPISIDLERSTTEDLRVIEPVTIVLVLVLIGLFFRSFVASSIPPLSIGVALGITYAFVFLIGTSVMQVHYSVLTLLLTSMMGAGCDYCIFILSRYREERRNGRTKEDAVRQAVTWAGESIATSGATVIIGFGVLSIGRFALMSSMGVALAFGIAVALLVALTLLPSLLLLLGDRMFWPSRLDRPVRTRFGAGYFTRSARLSIKHAKLIVVVALIVSVPTTYLVYSMQTSYDFIGSMPNTESVQGLDALTDGFGGGKVNPTQVALSLSSSVTEGTGFDPGVMRSIENVTASIASLPNVKQVTGPTSPNGVAIDYTNATVIAQYSGIINRMIGDDGKAVLLTITFAAEPFAKESIDSIGDLRQIALAAPGDPHIVRMYVGGSTASMYDISTLVMEDFGNMEWLVIIGIYVVLLVALGSVINPLRLILTILLSISWTLAVTLVLFQSVLGQPVLYMVPMILLVVCLGLGMDYDVLLTTRIREEYAKGRGDREAIVYAVERTGGIITACGIIMAAAFGSMMLSNSFLLKQFGFALMFAILLDATVVRIYLVPAIMSLLSKWNWWAPGPLRRINAKRSEEVHHVEEPFQRSSEKKV
jgi:RND superfamily putative drug exporter